MDSDTTMTPEEGYRLLQKAIEKAANDKAYAKRLLDPKLAAKALAEVGLDLPAGVELSFVQGDDPKVHIQLPTKGDTDFKKWC